MVLNVMDACLCRTTVAEDALVLEYAPFQAERALANLEKGDESLAASNNPHHREPQNSASKSQMASMEAPKISALTLIANHPTKNKNPGPTQAAPHIKPPIKKLREPPNFPLFLFHLHQQHQGGTPILLHRHVKRTQSSLLAVVDWRLHTVAC